MEKSSFAGHILALILLVGYTNSVSSQNYLVQYYSCQGCTSSNHDGSTTFTYDSAPITFTSSNIASDYGPRDHGSDHYDWHGGVDFSSEPGNEDFGDALVNLRSGTIERIGPNKYKYIFIDGNDTYTDASGPIEYDFGYGHIFTKSTSNQKSGNFFLARSYRNFSHQVCNYN